MARGFACAQGSRRFALAVATLLVVGGAVQRVAVAQSAPPLFLVERWSSGVLDGDDRFEFGNIEDIAVSTDGRYVFVLDRLRFRLTAFSRTGGFIGSAGRDGAGPGEFRYPSAVIADGSVAIVFDAALGRASTWVVRGNKRPARCSSRPAMPACSMIRSCSCASGMEKSSSRWHQTARCGGPTGRRSPRNGTR